MSDKDFVDVGVQKVEIYIRIAHPEHLVDNLASLIEENLEGELLQISRMPQLDWKEPVLE